MRVVLGAWWTQPWWFDSEQRRLYRLTQAQIRSIDLLNAVFLLALVGWTVGVEPNTSIGVDPGLYAGLLVALGVLAWVRYPMFLLPNQVTLDLEAVPFMALWLLFPGALTLVLSLVILATALVLQRVSLSMMPTLLAKWGAIVIVVALLKGGLGPFEPTHGWHAIPGLVALVVVVYGVLVLGRYVEDWRREHLRLVLSWGRAGMWCANILGMIGALGVVLWLRGGDVLVVGGLLLGLWLLTCYLEVTIMRLHRTYHVTDLLVEAWDVNLTVDEIMAKFAQIVGNGLDGDEVLAYVRAAGEAVRISRVIWRGAGDVTLERVSMHDGAIRQEFDAVTTSTTAHFWNAATMPEELHRHGWIEALCLPVSWDGMAMGAFVVGYKDLRQGALVSLKEDELNLLINTMSGLIYTSGLMQNMLWAASHDDLTGLPNEVWLREVYGKEVGVRSGASALLFIDINRFKQYNDTYGHAVGDEVLGLVGTTLRDRIKDSDLAVRLHGDEFALLLFGLNSIGDLRRVAARLMDAVRNVTPSVPGAEPLTISVGGVYGLTADLVVEDALKLGSEYMYICKRSQSGAPSLVSLEPISVAVGDAQPVDMRGLVVGMGAPP